MPYRNYQSRGFVEAMYNNGNAGRPFARNVNLIASNEEGVSAVFQRAGNVTTVYIHTRMYECSVFMLYRNFCTCLK